MRWYDKALAVALSVVVITQASIDLFWWLRR